MDKEVAKYLIDRLKLNDHLTTEEMTVFLARFQRYFRGNASKNSATGVGGRTLGTLKYNMDELLKFLTALGCTEKDFIEVIDKAPDLLNIDIKRLYIKYLILGLLPICEEDPEYRLRHIVNKPQDIRTSENVMYARIKFALNSGYPSVKLNWNMVVHATRMEYGDIFVKRKYGKSYKVFDNADDYKELEIVNRYPLTDDVIRELKQLKCNEEVVARYEEEPKFGM